MAAGSAHGSQYGGRGSGSPRGPHGPSSLEGVCADCSGTSMAHGSAHGNSYAAAAASPHGQSQMHGSMAGSSGYGGGRGGPSMAGSAWNGSAAGREGGQSAYYADGGRASGAAAGGAISLAQAKVRSVAAYNCCAPASLATARASPSSAIRADLTGRSSLARSQWRRRLGPPRQRRRATRRLRRVGRVGRQRPSIILGRLSSRSIVCTGSRLSSSFSALRSLGLLVASLVRVSLCRLSRAGRRRRAYPSASRLVPSKLRADRAVQFGASSVSRCDVVKGDVRESNRETKRA